MQGREIHACNLRFYFKMVHISYNTAPLLLIFCLTVNQLFVHRRYPPVPQLTCFSSSQCASIAAFPVVELAISCRILTLSAPGSRISLMQLAPGLSKRALSPVGSIRDCSKWPSSCPSESLTAFELPMFFVNYEQILA